MNRSIAETDVSAFIAKHERAIVDLLCDMIACNSVTGNEGPIAALCADWLKRHRIDVTLQPVDARHNVIGAIGGSRDPSTLVISGHLDTVPANEGAWTRDPHTPAVTEGRVYGLGASDMKASLVGGYFASLFLRDLDLPGRVVTAYTVEEETTGLGSREFLAWAEREKFLDFAKTSALVTEPTGLDHISLGNRGLCFVHLKISGLGGHGSRPHLANNPIDRAHALIGELPDLTDAWNQRYPDPDFGGSSVTVTSVISGDSSRQNVIPQEAAVMLDCRLTRGLYDRDFAPFRHEIETFVDRFRGDGFQISAKFLYPRPGHKLAADHRLPNLCLAVLRENLGIDAAEARYTPAGNDAVYFGNRGVATVNKIGPGHPECAHRVNEFVTVDNLLKGVELFIWMGLRYFAGTSLPGASSPSSTK